MKQRHAFHSTIAVILLTAMACGEHVPSGPGPGDHTPPSVSDAVAWDVTHVIVVFDERVTRFSANRPENYKIVGLAGPKVSGSELSPAISNVTVASLHADGRTVTLTTVPMSNEPYVVSVTGVTDVHGNTIKGASERPFDGTDISDTTPAEVVFRQPQTGTKGISTRAFVTIIFSEPVDVATVGRGFRVRGDGAQLTFLRQDDALTFTCGVDLLQPATTYTVSVKGVEDLARNIMPDLEWTFDTAPAYDTTTPRVISSYPANGAVNVDVHANLSLTFSEPMDPYSVSIRPRIPPEAMHWSNGNRKVICDTEWGDGYEYTIQIRPGEMKDQAGNPSTNLYSLIFSTSPEIETGGFAGRVLIDPKSPQATDPAGALVFAAPAPRDIYTSVVTVVSPYDTYAMKHLPSGTYYPLCVVDANRDGLYQPQYGDPIGAYGVSNWFLDNPKTLNFSGAYFEGIDIPLYDPTAIYGRLTYSGSHVFQVHIGIFDPAFFNPQTSVPVASVVAVRDGTWDYTLNTLDTGPIANGSYYVMAYSDWNGDQAYTPSKDPMGVYGGAATPIAVDIRYGEDAPAIDITLQQPPDLAPAGSVRWPDSPPSPRLQLIKDILADGDAATPADLR